VDLDICHFGGDCLDLQFVLLADLAIGLVKLDAFATGLKSRPIRV
jgi:hypothetical protein